MKTEEVAVVGYADGPQANETAIDWEAYAKAYDLIPEIFPAYRENMAILRQTLETVGLNRFTDICDAGAGTGNYIVDMATYLPDANFIHVDSDEAMTEIARRKYQSLNNNVDILEKPVQQATFEAGSFDLIVCINALYAMSPQNQTLARFKRWLRQDGVLFIIDFGRRQKVGDWISSFLQSAISGKIKRKTYAEIVRRGPTLVRQGIRGTKGQENGSYHMHTTEEFGQLIEKAGFEISQLRAVYRGYADLVVARKS